jgi:hypothetical protein
LVVTDDSSPNYLYINKGDGTFQDASFYSGFALNQDARETASMGLAVGDYRNNGKLDLYTTTFSDDYKTLYRNDGDGNFVDITPQMGIAEPTYPFLSWGTEFFDYDNDGWKDLLIAQGHDLDTIELTFPQLHYREPMLLARNLDGKKFVDVSPISGDVFTKRWVGRGMAIGDIDNDGRIDAVVTENGGPAHILINETKTANHWLGLNLIGHRSNRDAIGALVKITTSTGSQWETVSTSGSYLSSSDKRLHFGLGANGVAQAVEIHWPSGIVQTLKNVPGDRYMTIDEPVKPQTEQ